MNTEEIRRGEGCSQEKMKEKEKVVKEEKEKEARVNEGHEN